MTSDGPIGHKRPATHQVFPEPEPQDARMFVQRYREPRGYPGPQASLAKYTQAMRSLHGPKWGKKGSSSGQASSSAVTGGTACAGNKSRQQDKAAQIESAEPSFPQFAKLPPELRENIWEKMLPGPRIIKVIINWLPKPKVEHKFNTRSRNSNSGSGAGTNPNQDDFEWATPQGIARVPVLLQICKESRNFGLKYYSLAFEHQLAKKPVYMNFDIDNLYFTSWQTFFDFAAGGTARTYRKHVLGKLQHMIIHGHLCYPEIDTWFTTKQLGWEKLKTLHLMETWCANSTAKDLQDTWEGVLGPDVKLPSICFLTTDEIKVLVQS